MNVYPVGFDFGNSETCTVLIRDGVQITKSMPSVTASADSSRYSALSGKAGDSGCIYQDDALEVYVGELAMEQSNSVSITFGDIERYWSSTAKVMLLASVASMVNDYEFAINVVTGLPIDMFIRRQDAKRAIANKLNGDYYFTINGKERVVHVTVARVLMEGAGAMSLYGRPGNSEQAVVDIGGRTTDLYVTRGQVPVESLCRSGSLGVGQAAERLNGLFERDYGRPLEPLELRKTLYAAVTSGQHMPSVYVDGSLVKDLRERARNAIDETGDKIIAFISRHWNQSETGKVASSYSMVVVIGGGYYYFRDKIVSRIPHVHEPPEPEMANARGYAKAAEFIVQRQRMAG